MLWEFFKNTSTQVNAEVKTIKEKNPCFYPDGGNNYIMIPRSESTMGVKPLPNPTKEL